MAVAELSFAIALGTFIWRVADALNDVKKKPKNQLKEDWGSQIEPVFSELMRVHNDYISSLKEFYDLAKRFDHPTQELFNKIKSDAGELAALRSNLRMFVDVVKAIAGRTRHVEGRKAISELAESIDNYFNATSFYGKVSEEPRSWFTSFIQDFDACIRRGENPWEESNYRVEAYGYSSPPVKTLIEYVKQLYSEILPMRWDRVMDAKRELHKLVVT